MTAAELQQLCQRGQEQLVQMEYLAAEGTLEQAEAAAWEGQDWDTLYRLYMPLQEARRQKRQRCGEGIVCLDLCAQSAGDALSSRHIVENYPHGQLLVAGWGTIQPAKQVRDLAVQHELYLETFLGVVYPLARGKAVVIVPSEDVEVPPLGIETLEPLLARLPAGCLVLHEQELFRGRHKGSAQTYAHVMALWERLHTPFLSAADRETETVTKMQGYRKTIRVDYACELAHQRLADVARSLARKRQEIPAR